MKNSMMKLGMLALVGGTMSMLSVSGCGDNNLEQIGTAQITLENPTGGQFQLENPVQPDRPQLQTTRVTIRNDGEASSTLTLSEFEWLAKPARLFIQNSSSTVGSCSACSGQLCIPTASGATCVETGVPAGEVTIGGGLSEEFRFYVEQGSAEIACPEVPAGLELPGSIVAERFCGALRFKHNAITTTNTDLDERIISASQERDGQVTLFFVNDGKSGVIDLTENFIEFEGVAPGGTYMRAFSVQNAGLGDLEIEAVRPDTQAQLLTIAGPNTTTIAPSMSQEYTLQLVIPPDADPEDLEFETSVRVISNAVNASANQILVRVTKDTGPVPTISTTCDKLRFDVEPSQDFEVTNVGGTTLQVTGVSFEPSTLSAFYSVQLDGEDFTRSEFIPTALASAPDRNKRTFSVNFMRPDGNTNSAVGTMRIRHNDQGAGGVTRCVLLGDAGDVPVAELVPSTFTLTTAVASQDRSFAIINRGTAPLQIDDAMKNVLQVGGVEEFELIPDLGMATIQPDEVFEGRIEYRKTDDDADIVELKFTSNFVSPDNDFSILVSTRSSNKPLPAITLNKSFDAAAKVGEVARFDLAGSEPAGALSSSRWTLLAKPAGSKAYINSIGDRTSFVPDVAGSYKLAVTVFDEIDNQEILEFTAQN